MPNNFKKFTKIFGSCEVQIYNNSFIESNTDIIETIHSLLPLVTTSAILLNSLYKGFYNVFDTSVASSFLSDAVFIFFLFTRAKTRFEFYMGVEPGILEFDIVSLGS